MQDKIRPGYKQTEVGVIPEDWDAVRVDQIGLVKGGKRLPLGRSLTERRTPHPYIRVSDMGNGTVESNAVLFVPEDVFPYIRNYRIFVSDLYVSVAGTLGLVGRIPKMLDGANLTENADKITELKCDRDFLFFWLSSNPIQSEIYAKRTVGAQPKLAIQQIEAFEIALPPTLPEQRAIAAALSDADALIAALEAMIAKKRDLKQAAMQQLLTGKTRLPGFSGEWQVKRLGELIEYEQPTKYLVSSTDYDDSYDIPVLTAGKSFLLGHTNENEGVFAQLPVIIFDDFTTATQFVDFPFKAKSSAMKLLKPRSPNVNLRLVYEMMQTIDFVMFDHKRYWISEYQNIEVPFPTLAEQTAIAEVLSDMDADLAAFEDRAAKARAIKQGMMQELLTGKVRLL